MINQPERKKNIIFHLTEHENIFVVWSFPNMKEQFKAVNGVVCIEDRSYTNGESYYVTINPIYDVGDVQNAMAEIANLVAQGVLE